MVEPQDCIFGAPPFFQSTLCQQFQHHPSGGQEIKLSAIFTGHIPRVGVDAVPGGHPAAKFLVFLIRHSFLSKMLD